MLTPTDLLRLVLDPLRLAVLGAAASGPVDSLALAAALEVDEKRLRRELRRLVESGIVTRDLVLDREALRDLAKRMPREAAAGAEVLEGPWNAEEIEVLGRFFSGGSLTSIPSSRSKRGLVLERIVEEFEPGMRYAEREVDSQLQVFHPGMPPCGATSWTRGS